LRKGIGLISTLIILLLVATLTVMVLKISFISISHVSDTYMKERAELFMQSAIENALLAIEGYKRNTTNKCLQTMHFVDENKRFEANVTVLKYYCYNLDNCPCDNAVKIETDKSHGNVLLKVIVNSISSPKNNNKKIRIEKITLQRP